MKKLFGGAIAYAALLLAIPAVAAPLDNDTARLEALARENDSLRKENAALRERARLQSENAALREKVRARSSKTYPAESGEPSHKWSQAPSITVDAKSGALPVAVIARAADPRIASAYGADLGVPLKAPHPAKGEFNVFAEGGIFWTGGDPARTIGFGTAAESVGVGPPGGPFNLNPRLGWDAAVGFDYRFAGSPWHISAQFRYGAATKSDGDTDSFGPAALATSIGVATVNATAQTTASNKETHWLADFAFGRDVITGPDAMQVKVGVRVAELTSKIKQVTNDSVHATQFPFVVGGAFADETDHIDTQQDASFRGAGPRIGVEGAIPLPAGWEFDYLAGAAVLFGTRRFERVESIVTTVTSNVLPSGTDALAFRSVDQKGAAVGNVDLQAGVAYWVTPNFRMNASYRLDAYFGAITTLDVAGNQRTADRYFHGPRIAGTVRF